MHPEQIAERIWPGRELVLERLSGGLTNQNFKVAVDGEVCVLRIGGKDSDLLAIDRVVEHGASLVASGLGIGPEVVGFVEPEGYLLTRFMGGGRLRLRRCAGRRRSSEPPGSFAGSTTGLRFPAASTRFGWWRPTLGPQARTASRCRTSSSGRTAWPFASRQPAAGPSRSLATTTTRT